MSLGARYRSDGCGRDSYVHEQIRKPAKISDLAQRRDTLPDNVYKYLKEQIHREEYCEYIRELQTLGNTVNTQLGGGRRASAQERAALAEEDKMEAMQKKHVRHHRIKVLYEREMQQWQDELQSMGLAIEGYRE